MLQFVIFIMALMGSFAFSRWERSSNALYRKWYNFWNSKERKLTEETTEGFFFQRNWKTILSNSFFMLGVISLLLWLINSFVLSFGLALTIDSLGLWVALYFGILGGVGLINAPTILRQLKDGGAQKAIDVTKGAVVGAVTNTVDGLKEVVEDTKEVFSDEDDEPSEEPTSTDESDTEISSQIEEGVEEEIIPESEEVLELKDLSDTDESLEEEPVEEEVKKPLTALEIRNQLRNDLKG